MVPNDESRPIAFAPLPARRPPSRARPSSRATSAHLDVDGRRESSGPKVDAKKISERDLDARRRSARGFERYRARDDDDADGDDDDGDDDGERGDGDGALELEGERGA